jgi:signal transduction histidine kinase/ActR/RegA family two-component response regulator
MADLGIVTTLGVPISAHERIEGVLFVSNRVPRPFTEHDEAILSRLADKAAVAIQNAQLHGELREKLAQTETLLGVSQDLTGTLDATEMMRRVAKTAAQALGADMAGAFFADAEQRDLRPIAGYHVPPHLLADFMTSAIPIKGHRLLEEAWERRQAVWSSDVEADTRVDRGVLQRFPHRSALFCPMVVQGAPIGGVFLTWFEQEHRFTPAEVQLIEGISRQAGVALANARLVEELKTRHGRLESLLEVTRQLSRIQPLPSLLEGIAQVCGQLLGSNSVGIRLVEGDELVLSGVWDDGAKVATKVRLKIGESISGCVAVTGEALLVTDPENDPRLIPEHRAQARNLGYRAWLAVPIKMGERLVGVLSVRTKQPAGFSADDVAIATAFASQAAVTIENTRLYHEVRRGYDELSQTQDQLMHAQKMEAVGRLAGGIAHDFNNLLTVVIGRSQFALARLEAGNPVRSDLEIIGATGKRAAALTRQLLAFSRKQVLKPTVLDLATVVAELTPMLQRLVGEDVEFAIVPGPGEGSVLADRGQLEQVLANLVVNARDAMPRGGRLTIRTEHVELDAACTGGHPEVRPGPYAILAVSDTGSGMSPEVQARIFEPFFTTKEVGKGTGLGLSTIYGIVRQHAGWIAVESEPGRGSTFKIYLPRIAEAAEPPKSAPAPVETPGGVETILLVEDEAEVLALAREALAMKGYTVLEAPNGGEAVRIAAERISPIHLLVTDVVMPGLNGREVAARVRRSHPESRVLYMSGYTDDAIARHWRRNLALAFLAKPFTPHGLALKVREVLDALAPREKPSSELDSETGAGRYAATRGCSNGWSS